MKLETLNYTTPSGWSVDTLPPLDSDCTLVVAFGAPDLDPGPTAQPDYDADDN
jgi:hypothetical protein